MKRSIEEIVEFELKKRTEWSELRNLFNGAIARLRYAWDRKYAWETKEVACRVMSISGFCNGIQCERCYLCGAYKNALEEIEIGLRHKPVRHNQANRQK